jgi:hypothetical protein
MGNGTGVHKEDQVKNLTPEQRRQLRAEIIQQVRQLYDSKDIKEMPSDQDLESFMQKNPDIRQKVQGLVRPTYEGYQKR